MIEIRNITEPNAKQSTQVFYVAEPITFTQVCEAISFSSPSAPWPHFAINPCLPSTNHHTHTFIESESILYSYIYIHITTYIHIHTLQIYISCTYHKHIHTHWIMYIDIYIYAYTYITYVHTYSTYHHIYTYTCLQCFKFYKHTSVHTLHTCIHDGVGVYKGRHKTLFFL